MSEQTEIQEETKPKEITSYEELHDTFQTWKKEEQKIIGKPIDGALELADLTLDMNKEDRARAKEALWIAHFAVDLAYHTFSAARRTEDYPVIVVKELKDSVNATFSVVKRENGKKVPYIKLGFEYIKGLKGNYNNGEFEYSPESFARLINTGVEEYSHMVRDNLAWPNNPGKVERENTRYQKNKQYLEQVEGTLDKLEHTVRDLVERSGPYKAEVVSRLFDEYDKVFTRRDFAISEYLSMPEELMGLEWKRRIGKYFLPWSESYKTTVENYERAIKYKKSKK